MSEAYGTRIAVAAIRVLTISNCRIVYGSNSARANLERFLEDKEDRAYVDAWTAVAEAFSEMKIADKAAYYYRKVLEISPNMIELLKRQARTGDIPREIAAAALKEL